jgi:two-component system response regulator AtoC
MDAPILLIVDDEESVRSLVREWLTPRSCTVIEGRTAADGLMRISGEVDLVLLQFPLPDSDGLNVLQRMRELAPDTVIVLMSAVSAVEAAVDAMRHGADDYVSKPLDLDTVTAVVAHALERNRLRRVVRALRAGKGREYGFDVIIGASPVMVAVKSMLGRVAASPATTVLLMGETGTGKHLAAKAIHYNSDRATQPFIDVACSAFPEPLLESELFGDERGVFTGAPRQKRALFEVADRGTAFLDDIGEVTPALQPTLLRFLEEHCFTRVGGLHEIQVDVRVVAATNRDLYADVKAGRFREDLCDRLHAMPVCLPPLRERPGDILLLANHFIDRYNSEFGKRVRGVMPEAMALLEHHRWPGNVCELRNVIERAMLLLDSDWIGADAIAPLVRPEWSLPFRLPADGVNLEAVEQQLVVQALDRAGGNQTQAGHLLGLNRDQVRYRIAKFGLGVHHLVDSRAPGWRDSA